MGNVFFPIPGASRRRGGLLLVPSQKQYPSDDNKSHIHDIDHHVSNEAMNISRGIARLKDLRRSHVARRPANESHGHTDALLRLSSHIPRDERDDHVALGEKELRAIKCNEHASGVGFCRLYANDDSSADNARDTPQLLAVN